VSVAIFCYCNKLVKYVEYGGSGDYIAFRGAEAGKGDASDATCIPRELGCVCVCFDCGRCLL